MSELKKLNRQRDQLLAEQKALGVQLQQLQAREAAAPVDYNFLGNPLESPEGAATREQREAVEQRAQIVEHELKNLKRAIAYLEKLGAVDSDLSRAQAEEKKLSKRVHGLRERLERISERVKHIRAEQDQAVEAARLAELEAAQQIAKATAAGDEHAGRAAQSLMLKASEAVAKAMAQHGASLPVVNALEAEASLLASEMEAASDEVKLAREAVRDAMRVRLGAEWDKSVGALEALGAQLLAQGVRWPLTELNVPVFAPWLRAVTYEELCRRLKWTDEAA